MWIYYKCSDCYINKTFGNNLHTTRKYDDVFNINFRSLTFETVWTTQVIAQDSLWHTTIILFRRQEIFAVWNQGCTGISVKTEGFNNTILVIKMQYNIECTMNLLTVKINIVLFLYRSIYRHQSWFFIFLIYEWCFKKLMSKPNDFEFKKNLYLYTKTWCRLNCTDYTTHSLTICKLKLIRNSGFQL